MNIKIEELLSALNRKEEEDFDDDFDDYFEDEEE